MGHRVRWAAVWALLAVWFFALMLGVGGGSPNILLAVALVLLVYELLAVDPPPG